MSYYKPFQVWINILNLSTGPSMNIFSRMPHRPLLQKITLTKIFRWLSILEISFVIENPDLPDVAKMHYLAHSISSLVVRSNYPCIHRGFLKLLLYVAYTMVYLNFSFSNFRGSPLKNRTCSSLRARPAATGRLSRYRKPPRAKILPKFILTRPIHFVNGIQNCK